MTKRAPVEAKVKWATVAAYVGSVAGLAGLQAVVDVGLIRALPDVVEPLVLALVPAVTTALAGYKAAHTPRPDLPEGPDDVGEHEAGPGRPPFRA